MRSTGWDSASAGCSAQAAAGERSAVLGSGSVRRVRCSGSHGGARLGGGRGSRGPAGARAGGGRGHAARAAAAAIPGPPQDAVWVACRSELQQCCADSREDHSDPPRLAGELPGHQCLARTHFAAQTCESAVMRMFAYALPGCIIWMPGNNANMVHVIRARTHPDKLPGGSVHVAGSAPWH